jgi:two-component system, NarL family, sensor kinase
VFFAGSHLLADEPAEKTNPSARVVEKEHYDVDSLVSKSWNILPSNPDSARILARLALSLTEADDVTSRIRLTNLTGISFFIQANYNRALEYYLEALTIALDAEQYNHVAHAYNNIGLVNFRSGNYKEAIDFFLQAVGYYEDLEDIRNMASTNNNIGILYSTIDNFEKAHFHYKEALNGFESQKDSIGIAASWSNLGSLYLKMEQIDSAFFYLDQAIAMETVTKNKFGLSATYGEKAEVFFHIQDFENALEYFRNSAAIAREILHSYQEVAAMLGIAKTLMEMGQITQALEKASLAMDLADQIDTDQLRHEVHEVFAQVYERAGDYKMSLEHFRTSVMMKEKLIDQSKLHQIYNQEIQYLSQAKEIQQLEIQRQELMISRKNSTILFITFASILIMLGIILLYHTFRYRQIASHQKAILDLNEKKSRAAVEAELQERKRIGQEIHDGLGQMLSVARLNISVIQQKMSLSEERKKELLDAALFSVDQAFYELRDIAHNLAPSVLSEKGFVSALKSLVEQVNQSKQICVKLEVFGVNGPLDNLIENTLYRATQELLNNAIKHSRASEIFLQLVKNENEITLIVEDNGVGFDENTTLLLPGGGLNNIRSRVENLNGSVFMDSLPERGTIVTIVIPVKKNKKNAKKTYSGFSH